MIGSYLTPAGELGKRTKMSMIRLPRYGISPSNTSSPLYPASWSRRTVNASAGTMIPRAKIAYKMISNNARSPGVLTFVSPTRDDNGEGERRWRRDW